MANSGRVTSGSGYGGLYMVCDWSITNINNEAGTANLNWHLFVDGGGGSSTSYVVHSENYLNVNDGRVWTLGNGSGSYSDPVNMYTPYWNNKSSQEYQTSGYTFTPCWIWRRGELSSGSRQITYNDDGVPQNIRLNGWFRWYYGSSGEVGFDTGWFKPDNIERYNKAQSSTNKGSNWSKNKYFWKTTNYGATWVKCKGYKTTNSGNSWSKL